jgi:hypothetical protein
MPTKGTPIPTGSWPDRHPALSIGAAAVLIYVGLRIYSKLHDGPVLLASADPQQRLAIYGQIANSAVAILGIALTVLTILLALPDRPIVKDVQASETWPRLRELLMTTALLALIALVASHVATAIDNGVRGREWLEQAIVASSVSAVIAIALAGLTFWLVLVRIDEPDDPSRGRGDG